MYYQVKLSTYIEIYERWYVLLQTELEIVTRTVGITLILIQD